MGSFLLAGAVKGLGEGMVQKAEFQQDEEMLEKQSSLAEARDKRIAALNNKYRTEEAATQNKYAVDAAEVLEGNRADATDLAVIDRQYDAAIAQGYEQENIALRGANATAAARAANAPTQKYSNRFETKPQIVGADYATEWATVYDNETSREYTMQGNMRVEVGAPNDKPLIPESAPGYAKYEERLAKLTSLSAGPELEAAAERFVNKYQYLPTSVFSRLKRELLSGTP